MVFNFIRFVQFVIFACSTAWNVSAGSNTGIVCSNPTWSMDVCVRLFCVCAVLCVQVAALRRADPRPRSPTDCVKNKKNWKATKIQQKAVEP
jgi:hypothetical protein